MRLLCHVGAAQAESPIPPASGFAQRSGQGQDLRRGSSPHGYPCKTSSARKFNTQLVYAALHHITCGIAGDNKQHRRYRPPSTTSSTATSSTATSSTHHHLVRPPTTTSSTHHPIATTTHPPTTTSSTHHHLVHPPPSREDLYIFEITKNVRMYEWSRDESEDLFTDVVDSMEKTNDKDFELNAIVVVRGIERARSRVHTRACRHAHSHTQHNHHRHNHQPATDETATAQQEGRADQAMGISSLRWAATSRDDVSHVRSDA